MFRPYCMRAKDCVTCGGQYSTYLTLERTSNIASTFSHNPWRLRTSWASNTLVDDMWAREDLLNGSYSHPRRFPASLFELRLVRNISDIGQSGAWSRISCIRRPREVCTWWPNVGASMPPLCRWEAFCFSDRQRWGPSTLMR